MTIGRRGTWSARRQRRATGDAPPGLPAEAPADARLPAPLFDLRRRLMASFDLSELQGLAFDAGIARDSVPGDTRQMFALGLVRAAWCRGLLPALLAAAAAEAPRANWACDVAALPAPPAAGCEDAPLPRWSIFGDWRQVLALVLPLLLVAAVAAGLFLQARRPARLTSDFNVAVAGVQVTGGDPAENEATARRIQATVADLLTRELNAALLESVAVSDARMPVVTDEPGAERLARAVNAHVVLYGQADIDAAGQVTYSPSFYVNPALGGANTAELGGEHPLNGFVSFPSGDRPLVGQTADGAALLTQFVQALAYLQAGDLARARWAIDGATARSQVYADQYGPFDGRAVLYLFAGHIARLQAGGAGLTAAQQDALLGEAQGYNDTAVCLDPNYGRALIGRANVYFDRQQFPQALHWYEAAAALRNQPPDALIGPKAALGLGNVYLAQLGNRPAPCPDERGRLAEGALGYYQTVLDAAAAPQPDERLAALAAAARLHRGQVHYLCRQADDAAGELRAGLRLRPEPALAKEIRDLLAIVEDGRE